MNLAVFSAICTAELAAASQPPNVLFVVGDDVGYSDFGYFNDQQASNMFPPPPPPPPRYTV